MRCSALLNAGVHPVVPSRGSVGASGDLAPLAHLALVLIGEGEALSGGGRVPGARGARDAPGWRRSRSAPKEGPGAHQRHAGLDGRAGAGAGRAPSASPAPPTSAAALSIDALRGSTRPFDARIHAARPHAGQAASAANLSRLMAGSAINASHADCGRVQDAYSERCAAQVHGAAATRWRSSRRTVEIEANASTDNPMVFAEQGDIVSGGNFHGAPVGLARGSARPSPSRSSRRSASGGPSGW